MKKAIRLLPVLIIVLSFNFSSYSQLFPEKNYPRGYFKWPVGATIGIAANFGELRPNHYHMGLDVRTDRKQNIPVYAAASGYIAKVKIEPFGFGRCIYINHPNGLTTLYAHLNDFNPALEKYVTDQQYSLQQWQVFLDIPQNLFPVSQGQLIAYSGSTGGSQGPHTHFEIRDTKTDKVLNPLLFDMPIKDHIPPDIIRLAIYDRCKSTYEQVPLILGLKKVNGIYQPSAGNITINTEKVSFAITAYDRYTGSTNQNGIYKAIVFDNDILVSGFEMDSISYDETRYLNAHIDYKLRSHGGPYLQHLSPLPGYINGIYRSAGNSNGVITLENEAEHSIRIEISDAAGNISNIKFKIKSAGQIKEVTPNSDPLFRPGNVNIFENDHVRFYLTEKCIYDSFHFHYNEMPGATGETIYHLHDADIPVHEYFPVSLLGDFTISDTGKVVMKRTYGNKKDFVKANYNNGWYSARFREFGNYQLQVDRTPPVISGISISRRRISFSITDNTEELQNFNAYLDGQWLRFSNDKGRSFVYVFDEHCPPGPHELKITVEDQAGNKSERIFHFTR